MHKIIIFLISMGCIALVLHYAKNNKVSWYDIQETISCVSQEIDIHQYRHRIDILIKEEETKKLEKIEESLVMIEKILWIQDCKIKAIKELINQAYIDIQTNQQKKSNAEKHLDRRRELYDEWVIFKQRIQGNN